MIQITVMNYIYDGKGILLLFIRKYNINRRVKFKQLNTIYLEYSSINPSNFRKFIYSVHFVQSINSWCCVQDPIN